MDPEFPTFQYIQEKLKEKTRQSFLREVAEIEERLMQTLNRGDTSFYVENLSTDMLNLLRKKEFPVTAERDGGYVIALTRGN